MSNFSQDPGDDDMRAGDYVLGLLTPDEAHALEAEATQRATLAAAIAGWENRLQPLLAQISALPPPAALWQRVEASVFTKPIQTPTIGLWRSLPIWRAAAAGFAVAAAFAGIALLHRPEPPVIVATLLPPGQTGPVIIAQRLSNGHLVMTPSGKIASIDQHDFELWSLAAGATRPVSLGVMPPGGVILAANRVPQSGQLLISTEPRGGSPNGLPTGPVVWAGKISAGD